MALVPGSSAASGDLSLSSRGGGGGGGSPGGGSPGGSALLRPMASVASSSSSSNDIKQAHRTVASTSNIQVRTEETADGRIIVIKKGDILYPNGKQQRCPATLDCLRPEARGASFI